MTVRHSSTGRIGLTSITAAVSGLLLLLVIALAGNGAPLGDDVPEPVSPAQSDDSKAPEPAPAEEPAAPAEEPVATAEEPAAPAAPETDANEQPAASPDPNDEPAEPASQEPAPDTPTAAPAENSPAPAVEPGAAPAEQSEPLPPNPDESEPVAVAGEPSQQAMQDTPPATAAESAPALATDDDPAKAEPAPFPTKPAEADGLESVLPAPQLPDATAGQATSEMVEQPPVGQTPDATPDAPVAGAQPSKPELKLPPDLEAAMDDFMDETTKPELLRFVFRYQPWKEVLQWFADQSDLSLIMDAPPPGTFNYTDNRSYTPAEAIDLLNSVLLVKGYTLVRRERMLFVINLEDGIPENLVTTVPLEELDKRGEFELIGVLFQLSKFDPQEASTEIAKLIGPQGAVVVLPKTRQLHVTETAGRLRTIRDVIQRIEDPQGLLSGDLETYEFKNILPDEGLAILRQLLGIPADANAAGDDTFRFATDSMGMRLLFSGSADKIAKARKILEAVDVSTGQGQDSAALEALQLEVYPIAVADPESVLRVMQTLLEGLPGVRLSVDPKTGSLIALARPSDQATIRATIDQMQSEIRRIEVIYLQRVDPQLAAVSIRKMFGDSTAVKSTTGSATTAVSTAPMVEPDPAGRQLIVHGTENQIAQIRVLLSKMGETEFADGPVSTGSRIRILRSTGTSAETALQNLRLIWPTISDNPIQEVTPSAIIPSLGPRETIPARVPGKNPGPLPQRRPESDPTLPPGGIPGLYRPSAQPALPAGGPGEDRQTSHGLRGRLHLAAQTQVTDVPDAAEQSPSDRSQIEQPAQASDAGPSPAPAAQALATPKPKSPIIISRGPSGLMIASDDVEALDEFERLYNEMTGGMDPDRTELTVFYLKYAKATVVADTLTKIIGSGTTSSTTAGQDSILGQLIAGSLGSTMGSLLNLGAATLSPTGMLRITAEPRLNALIVEANATDLRTIEEVLKLLDQPESPEEILVTPRARLIPVYNMTADEVATIVKQVFADKMQSSSSRGGGGDQQRPSPADFIAAMRDAGGRGGSTGGQRSGSTAPKEEPERMTVGVDSRSNSLIVFATQQTYEEVRMLVEDLDSVAGMAEEDFTEIVTLTGNAEAMKAALMAIMGQNAVSNSTSSSSGRGTTTGRTGTSRTGTSTQPSGGMTDDMRRRMEAMRSMMGGRGGAPGGFGGAPGGGRTGGGR